jgi:hypothetical protein
MQVLELEKLPFLDHQGCRVVDGHRFRRCLTYRDESVTTAQAVDLTDVVWTVTVATQQGGAELLTAAATTNWAITGIYVEDAAAGQFAVNIAEGDVALLGIGQHWYTVHAAFPADHTQLPALARTILQGRLVVTA